MFELLGICLALSVLLAFHAVSTLAVALLWRVLQESPQTWTAARRARWLFTLRVLPGAVAAGCIGLLLIPSYWLYEPAGESAQELSLKLIALAALAMVGMSLAVGRSVIAWQATQRLLRSWLQQSVPVSLPASPIPAFRLRHPFPVVAVVGVLRPRLFVAEVIFQALTEEELTAAITHECGHLAARDNLKRSLMRACRDALLGAPIGQQLDRQWAVAIEEAADQFAARRGTGQAVELASALVKIARLIPMGVRPTLPAGAFLIGDGDGVARRVRLLATPSTVAPFDDSSPPSRWLPLCFALTATVGFALWSVPHMLLTVHQWIEAVVAALQ